MALNLFVQLDVDYASDEKLIAAGVMAELLYVRALAFCKRTLTDGKIATAQLPLFSHGIPSPSKHAAALVREGAWTATASGWRITAWGKRNASKAELEAKAAIASEAGVRGNHQRHHVDGKKPSPRCPLCVAEKLAESSGTRSGGESGSRSGAIAIEEVEVETQGEPEGEKRDDDDASLVGSLSSSLVHRLASQIAEHLWPDSQIEYGIPGRKRQAWINGTATRIAQERRDELLAALEASDHDVTQALALFTLEDTPEPPASKPEEPDCDRCDNTGRLHDLDGNYIGPCDHLAPVTPLRRTPRVS